MVKHWMNGHTDLSTLPPFRFRIVQQYKDSLSRQVGEALHIFYSKDKLLNSKNEYVQNCISRITISEETWERKERERREEEDEQLEERRMEDFKKLKQGNINEEAIYQQKGYPQPPGREPDPASLPTCVQMSTTLEIGSSSLAKRKEQPAIHSPKSKKRKVATRKKTESIQLELNISKWWRRMETSEKKNSNWLNFTPKPKRRTRRDTGWKLGYLSLWWMRMDRECNAQRVTSEENRLKNTLSKFLLRDTHNAGSSSKPVDRDSRMVPVEGETDMLKEYP